ncbi:MAG TPA: pilus assembly protein PilM [Firmicutes bacterium]|nr:pilus assembly protein PilM [Bacillota bacterium]
MLRTAVGLDIGHSYLKLVQLQKKRLGPPELTSCAVHPTPPGALDRGLVADPHSLGVAITELFEKSQARRDFVCVAISGMGLDLRQIELPMMGKNELRQAIAWELKDLAIYEHLPLEEIVFDFHPLTKGKTGDLVKILVVSARKSQIYGYINVCKQVGLALEIIDLGLLSLPYLIENPGPLCHIILGSESLQLLVCNAEGYRLGRLIPVGCRHLIEALAQDEGLSYEEAMQMLSHGWDTERIYGGEMQQVISQMISGIMQSLEYERVQQRHNSINDVVEEILVCGGGALFAEITQLLKNELGLPVRPFDPFGLISIRQEAQLNSWGPMLVPALALAYRGVKER